MGLKDIKGKTCSTCGWFQQVNAEQRSRFLSGGWCGWRPPARLAHNFWGAPNPSLRGTENACSEYEPVPTLPRPDAARALVLVANDDGDEAA